MRHHAHLEVELNCYLKCTVNFNLNAPSCASLYRPEGTPLGVPSDEPSLVFSIALTNAPLSVPSSAMSNASFLSPSYARRATTGGGKGGKRGEVSPALFRKLKKKCPDFVKNALSVSISELNFLFKMQS